MRYRVLFCLANVALALKVAAQSAVDVTRPEERQRAERAIIKRQEKHAQLDGTHRISWPAGFR